MLAESDDLSNIASNEIDSYLDQFIATLQDRYSHTAPAIVRTGEKILSNFTNPKPCKWCWLHHDRPEELCQKCVRLK
jgi:oligoendopeptidase F